MTLFGTLFHTLKGYMGWSDTNVLEVIAAERFTCGDMVTDGAILEVDDAVQCLERADVEKIKQAQSATDSRRYATKAFQEEFWKKAKAVRESSGGAVAPVERKEIKTSS